MIGAATFSPRGPDTSVAREDCIATRTSSRLLQEIARLGGIMAHPPPSSLAPPPPRRLTRASLQRATGTAPAATAAASTPTAPPLSVPDIEDAAGPVMTSRKRKIATTAPPHDRAGDVEVKRETEDTTTTLLKTPAARRARKPTRPAVGPVTLAATVAPPTDWEEMYGLVKAMRLSGAARDAAVDTMGCERLADHRASARDQRYQTLVALMLSSQTKDTVNAAAMRRLQAELPAHAPGAVPGLTLANVLAADAEVLVSNILSF